MQIANQRIVITGAASGIGRATLGLLARHRARIIAVDVDEARLDEAIRDLTGSTAMITPFACDLAGQACVDGLFAHATEVMNGIDLFIANAGFAYYEACDRANWQRLEHIYRVNVFAPIYSAAKMRELNGDRPYKVVITASAMGLLAIPGYAVYSSTKAALHRFAEGFRLELDKPSGLMLVYPIGTRTGFFAAAAVAAAPQPWPTQQAEHVARAIVRGIESDRQSVHPSFLFQLVLLADRFLPFVRHVEQWIEKRRFVRWLARRPHTADPPPLV